MSSIGEPITLGLLFLLIFVGGCIFFLFRWTKCNHNWNIVNQWYLLNHNKTAYKQQCSICNKTEIKHA